MKITILINISLLILPFLLAILYPNVGTLMAYLASFTCLFVIFILPIATYLKHKHTELKNPVLAKGLIENAYSIVENKSNI
jgi:amino acid permease